MQCPETLHLPSGSTQVEDADEEIFLLYTRKQQTASVEGGLGSHSDGGDLINVELTIENPYLGSKGDHNSKNVKGKRTKKEKGSVQVEVELHQSMNDLRNRKGDTGSVLWRLSLHLAKYLLTTHHLPNPLHPPLLPNLSNCRILELGSGTGFLGLALRSILDSSNTTSPKSSKYASLPKTSTTKSTLNQQNSRSPKCLTEPLPTTLPRHTSLHSSSTSSSSSRSKWIFSDQLSNLPLVHRNLRANAISDDEIGETGGSHQEEKKWELVELDWMEESKIWLKERERRINTPPGIDSHFERLDLDNTSSSKSVYDPDIIFAIDCIFNPSLSIPLVHTILRHSIPNQTIVIVASELRDSEALELFLSNWIELGNVGDDDDEDGEEEDGGEKWKIVRLGWDREEEKNGTGELDQSQYVVWVGWRIR